MKAYQETNLEMFNLIEQEMTLINNKIDLVQKKMVPTNQRNNELFAEIAEHLEKLSNK
ncbi:MAG: hypothetical protein AAGA85_12485 [Bacteroidota bacterium]